MRWGKNSGTFLVVSLLMSGLAWLFLHYLNIDTPLIWQRNTVEWQMLQPRALASLVCLPLLLLGLRFSLADLPWQQRWFGGMLRVLFLTLLALAASEIVKTEQTNRIAVVYLVDVSDSISDESLLATRAALSDSLEKKRPEDVVRLVTFAEHAKVQPLTLNEGQRLVPSIQELRHKKALSAASQPSAALRLAYGLFPSGTLKRAVLFSDGVETKGNLLAESNRAASLGIRLFAVDNKSKSPAEVAVLHLRTPAKVAIGEPFKVTAEIYATRPSQARARLYQGAMLNGLDGVRTLELDAGVNHIVFDSVVRVGGEVIYSLKLDQISGDHFAENNHADAQLEVPSRPLVLYIEGQPSRASYLSGALGAQQFDVDVRAPAAFPTQLAELERYAMVIVSDVPAAELAMSAQKLIERYVRDLGGGFLFAGGQAGFGLGGWANTTIERLLPVRMDAERRKEMPNVAMALVIDRSGSMSGLPMEMAKAACRATVGTLKSNDVVEIIAFDSTPKRYVKMQPARYRSRIENEIMRIQPGGGTAIFPALDAAYQDITVVQARKKHVILLTDGRASQNGIRDLVQAMIAESITVTTVGLGDGADSEMLRMIAETGGGRYHHVPDPNNLPRIFTHETEMIARQSAVQDWFPVNQTMRADFLKGIAIGTAPLLHGYVATQMKSAPAQQILASETGEPILARWRVGLGHALAWTSDVKNNWAIDWLRWPSFSRFWGQLVREHMRTRHRRELHMKTVVIGDSVLATVDAFTVDERFDNNITTTLSVKGLGQKGTRFKTEMKQIAPGRYQAEFALPTFGSYSLQADHVREGADGTLKKVGVSFGQVSYPYPAEYATFEPDTKKLSQAAAITGGTLNPSPSEVFDPKHETLTEYQPQWPRFLYVAIALFLFDLLVRRVRIFDRNFNGTRAVQEET